MSRPDSCPIRQWQWGSGPRKSTVPMGAQDRVRCASGELVYGLGGDRE